MWNVSSLAAYFNSLRGSILLRGFSVANTCSSSSQSYWAKKPNQLLLHLMTVIFAQLFSTRKRRKYEWVSLLETLSPPHDFELPLKVGSPCKTHPRTLKHSSSSKKAAVLNCIWKVSALSLLFVWQVYLAKRRGGRGRKWRKRLEGAV